MTITSIVIIVSVLAICGTIALGTIFGYKAYIKGLETKVDLSKCSTVAIAETLDRVERVIDKALDKLS